MKSLIKTQNLIQDTYVYDTCDEWIKDRNDMINNGWTPTEPSMNKESGKYYQTYIKEIK